MNAPRTEASLRYFETTSFTQQHIRDRHSHIPKRDLSVPVGSMIIAEYREHALYRYARRVHRDQNHGLLLMFRRSGVRLAHEDRDFAAWIARARGPPFAAVDHIVIAIAGNAARDVGGIGRRYRRFRHRKARTYLAREQWLQPSFLLF